MDNPDTDPIEDVATQDTPEEDTREENVNDEGVNPLSMSDEDIMAMDAPEGTPIESDEDDGDNASSELSEDSDADDEGGSAKAAPTQRDIEAEHKALFSPIKAGGQTLEVKTVDEAISLMQKGADYHRKTEELAAHRKTIKTLEKAGIKYENLDGLIDLYNKDPKAIAKLIADADIDPFDIDTDSEETKNYQPQRHSVSDKEIELDETLKELETTPTYRDLIDVVGNQWDGSSREIVADNSQILHVLNDHMADGIYPIIQKEVDRQRALGNLQGLSDIAAYQQVGESINAQGGFDNMISDERRASWAKRQGIEVPAGVTYRPVQGNSDPNLDAKRRAASPTKSTSRTTKSISNRGNPLALSDEEFEKKFSNSFL